uniref:Uncharacterized protein n=1 Tax=uncultured bacterium BLR9 TaxID=506525 RepID=C0INB8_9BACT|nr:hypothetical protein AKSOIL_0159 [uncultured bacterium BLR9]
MPMRLIAFVLAAFVSSAAPAAAQSWQEYTYPTYSFGVSFPQEPKIETTTYQAVDGRNVQARVYSVTQPNGVMRMTVADLSDGMMEEGMVIDHAVKALSQGGEIKVDIAHRISRVYGRQLSISGADGSHNSVAVFFYKKRLYQIEGKALPGGEDGTADAIRFQQSLIFTDDTSNRSPVGRIFETLGQLF